MVLKVYNTASRKKQIFKPIENGKVGMYVCGITPYDLSHVGHARSYVAFDVIRRSLEFLGFDVKYIQNFTDIDDKILDRAKEQGVKPLDLSAKYIEKYFHDMDALGVKRADGYPRVTERIEEIIKAIESLVEKGSAYEVGGDVYLDVAKRADYGKLSGQKIEDLKAGTRVELNEKKKNQLDFALWKSAKPGEMSWKSPWGKGRPGWHIECSVMSIETLGPTIDFHGGGQDLIFPHHENEIAQSESYSGKPFVKFWLHNGLVTVDGEKMSKSLGNFVTVEEILERNNPNAVRFFLLSAHYRSPLDFSERALRDAGKGLLRIQNFIFNIRLSLETSEKGGHDGFEKVVREVKEDFVKALEDDFNIPKALANLFDFIRKVNTYKEGKPLKKNLQDSISTVEEIMGVLGLNLEVEVSPLVRNLVELAINERANLRDRKDFAGADRIRKKLQEIGIILEDRAKGTVWRFYQAP
jgi:cysteinyl-tRNA synthetase